MITAFLYPADPDHDGPLGPESIAVDRVSEVARIKDSILFVVAENPPADDLEKIVIDLGIHELHAEDILEGQQRTKLEQFGDEYLVTLHDCTSNDCVLHKTEIDIAFGEGWVLLVTRPDGYGGTDFPIDLVCQRFERQRTLHGPGERGFLLWALLDVIVDRFFDVSDAIDTALDSAEEKVFETTSSLDDNTPREIYLIQRLLVQFRRVSSPVRDVAAALSRREVSWFSEPATEHLNDVYDHVLRINDLVEAQRDVLAGLLDAHLSNVNNRMNDVMKKTSSWGAILLVPTLIAGIYGMNFRHLPELDWIAGYPMALGLMAGASGILYWRFKKQGWL